MKSPPVQTCLWFVRLAVIQLVVVIIVCNYKWRVIVIV